MTTRSLTQLKANKFNAVCSRTKTMNVSSKNWTTQLSEAVKLCSLGSNNADYLSFN